MLIANELYTLEVACRDPAGDHKVIVTAQLQLVKKKKKKTLKKYFWSFQK